MDEAPEEALEYTPIRSKRGKKVHATSLQTPTRTACGKTCTGWIVATSHLDCLPCKAALHLPVIL